MIKTIVNKRQVKIIYRHKLIWMNRNQLDKHYTRKTKSGA